MPIPGRNVDDDAPGFNRAMQHRRDISEHKSEYSAGQMKAMHRGENVNEGTAGAAGEVKTSGRKLVPNEKLSGKKQETENGGQSKPGEVAFIAQRDAWHRLDRRKRGFSRDFTPGQVDRDAAGDKDGCVGQQ